MEKEKLDRLVRSMASALKGLDGLDSSYATHTSDAKAYDAALAELDIALGECIDEVMEAR